MVSHLFLTSSRSRTQPTSLKQRAREASSNGLQTHLLRLFLDRPVICIQRVPEVAGQLPQWLILRLPLHRDDADRRSSKSFAHSKGVRLRSVQNRDPAVTLGTFPTLPKPEAVEKGYPVEMSNRSPSANRNLCQSCTDCSR